jgi:sepiapterin reductase
MANAIDLSKTTYLLVTGASKGIGKRMAIETSRNLQSGSRVVLLARSLEGLQSTKEEILEINDALQVFTIPLDLTKPSIDQIDDVINQSFDASLNFELALIIHNVGTLGDVSKWVKDIESYDELNSYFNVNVHAPTILNNRLLKAIPAATKKLIVNLTSKAAICPFKSFGFYCMGKAAREMYFRMLAEEEKGILVLNYSPGPVESDMTIYAQSNSVSDETSGMFKNLRETRTILTAEQTTKRFLEVVVKGNYKSGDHIDFYDEI